MLTMTNLSLSPIILSFVTAWAHCFLSCLFPLGSVCPCLLYKFPYTSGRLHLVPSQPSSPGWREPLASAPLYTCILAFDSSWAWCRAAGRKGSARIEPWAQALHVLIIIDQLRPNGVGTSSAKRAELLKQRAGMSHWLAVPACRCLWANFSHGQ